MKTKSTVHQGRGVESFLAEHRGDVTGVIRGFDRLRLRASLRWLYQPSFMKRYLCEARVLLKDFGGYATAVSNRIRAAAHAFAAREHRPVRYLHSTALSKEELARTLAEGDRIDAGLIGLFDIVEPCLTYFVRGDHAGAPAPSRTAAGQMPASLLLFSTRRVWVDAPARAVVVPVSGHRLP